LSSPPWQLMGGAWNCLGSNGTNFEHATGEQHSSAAICISLLTII
jgi:hypothetical protein